MCVALQIILRALFWCAFAPCWCVAAGEVNNNNSIRLKFLLKVIVILNVTELKLPIFLIMVTMCPLYQLAEFSMRNIRIAKFI